MDIVLTLLAALIFAITLWDQFVTVFSTGGAGPLSKRCCGGLWRVLLVIHRHHAIHRILKYAGPAMILMTILTWYLLLGLSVFMLLVAYPGSVINNVTTQSADPYEVLYFTSSTISSLGYGDWVPSGPPWTLISTLSTLMATIILTVSLSYVLLVVSAAVDRRALATSVFAMGHSEEMIIRNANLQDPQGSLKNYLLSLSSNIDQQALRHLAYPVLKYFHATKPGLSPARAILLLSDALFLMDVQKPQSLQGVIQVVRSSIDNFVEFTWTGHERVRSVKEGKDHLARVAKLLWPEVDSVQFESAYQDYVCYRSKLLALCEDDGWSVG